MTTPTKIRSGESHERSNEKTTAITLVPTSAPSITASAALVGTRFLPTNEATIRHVAVLDWTMLVTPSPAISARKRFEKLAARIRRRFSPNTRSMKGTKKPDAAKKLADWASSKDAMMLYGKNFAITAQPGVAAPLANVPADYEKRLVKMDFKNAADNRERVLAEWTKRYDSKSEPKK